MSARSDRRAVLAGLAACCAVGGIGAAAGAGTARAAGEAAEAAIDDQRILELAAEFEQLERRRLALFDGPGRIADDDERDAAIEPFAEQQEQIMDRLALLNASSVVALGAVAAALKLWEADLFPDPADSTEYLNKRLTGWIATQAIALGGRKA